MVKIIAHATAAIVMFSGGLPDLTGTRLAQRFATPRGIKKVAHRSFGFNYEARSGRVTFNSEGNLILPLGNVPEGSPAKYLADPNRIIHALWPLHLRSCGDACWVLQLPTLILPAATWQTELTMRASFDSQERMLRIWSDDVSSTLGTSIKNFEVAVQGHLIDASIGSSGKINSRIRMDVHGRLPRVVAPWVTERSLRWAAAQVSERTLGMVLNQISKFVARDYRSWESEEAVE